MVIPAIAADVSTITRDNHRRWSRTSRQTAARVSGRFTISLDRSISVWFAAAPTKVRFTYHVSMATQKSKRAVKRSPGRDATATEASDLSERGARVLRRFRQIFYAIKTHFQHVEKSAGIGGAQLWALSIIQARPGIGVNDLATAMDIHQSTASNLVRALVERNLISASRTGVDRRAVHLETLAAGRAILRRAPGPFTGVLPKALASLDASTLTRLDNDLLRLIAFLDADESAGGTPLAQLLTKRTPRHQSKIR